MDLPDPPDLPENLEVDLLRLNEDRPTERPLVGPADRSLLGNRLAGDLDVDVCVLAKSLA